jgi:hypothetical protein
MAELIDDFFAEYPSAPGGSDMVDMEEADEIIKAVAKTVADLSARRYVSPVSDRPIDARDHEIRRRISSRRRSRFGRPRKTTLTSSPQRTAGSRRRDGQAATQPDTSTETNPCALRNARPQYLRCDAR